MSDQEHTIAWYKNEMGKLQKINEQLRQDNKRKDALIAALMTPYSTDAVDELSILAKKREEALEKYRQEYEERPDYLPPSVYQSDSNQMEDSEEGYDELDSMPEVMPPSNKKR